MTNRTATANPEEITERKPPCYKVNGIHTKVYCKVLKLKIYPGLMFSNKTKKVKKQTQDNN